MLNGHTWKLTSLAILTQFCKSQNSAWHWSKPKSMFNTSILIGDMTNQTKLCVSGNPILPSKNTANQPYHFCYFWGICFQIWGTKPYVYEQVPDIISDSKHRDYYNNKVKDVCKTCIPLWSIDIWPRDQYQNNGPHLRKYEAYKDPIRLIQFYN